MAEGKKDNRGGPRPNAGRKPVAIEKEVKRHIQEALDKDPNSLMEIWAQVIARAKAGSDRHQQILFNYYYGKPKENLEQPTEMIVHVVHEGN